MKKITKAVAAIMLTVAVVCATGCTKSDDSNNEGNNNGGNNGGGNQSNHEYVDLGLPSGTLWATCNVGATTPEGYGVSFAWGETTLKNTYNWSTYKWCDGTNMTLTKYCCYSNYGHNDFTDDLTILQPSDDAATVNWGNDWCIPTREQWKELRDNTNSSWTTINDVKGRLFTAINGESIFLPAAGLRWNNYHTDVGSYGDYWSNSTYGNDYAEDFYINSSGSFNVGGDSRDKGRSVRAVRKY